MRSSTIRSPSLVQVPVPVPGHFRTVYRERRCASRQYGNQPRCLPSEYRQQWVSATTIYQTQQVWVAPSVQYVRAC